MRLPPGGRAELDLFGDHNHLQLKMIIDRFEQV